tara:strand:- start:121 stop:831 length:711 start_codon:yes stop_codon:yes gene_type:complete
MRKKIDLSSNFSKKQRKKKDIKFIIIHYTGMQSEIESLKRLKNLRSKVSCHYLINRKGIITQIVKDKNIAWHAGKSRWNYFKNLNKFSIGIELVNKGHKLGYESFPSVQIQTLIKLCKFLKKKYNIKPVNFLGHSDIAPLRKIDPGEKFPWQRLSRYKIGKWHQLDKKKSEKNKEELKSNFFKNIFKIGYRYFNINKRDKKDKKIIRAFQQRYLPKKVTGLIDRETLKISHYLAKS